MTVPLLLGVLKNNWQLVALAVSIIVGAAFWRGEHELLLHTRTELAAKMALLAEAQALAKEQDEAALAHDSQQKAQIDVVQSQLASALQAHTLTGAALTASILRYENDRGAGKMCAGSGDPGGRVGSGPGAASGGGHPSVATVLAETPTACQAVIDQLGACQTILRTVKCQVPL